ncbi:DUF2894 domain-containing protein [uncultured Pseudacidovorax sp.]|uniref:DUF2894 domain-containing protein n=1 Tax=uncultured Pseudacidovorax sp. TaxID=679313 RepID=UPI0025EA889C|nr:DUF2894 domain-containing protein [uncultured Pseudacidovorax sp.]
MANVLPDDAFPQPSASSETPVGAAALPGAAEADSADDVPAALATATATALVPASAMAALQARLAAWRDAGADRADPAAFLAMEALARRTAGQPQRIQQLLLPRLEAALDRYAASLTAWPGPTGEARAAAPAHTTARAPLPSRPPALSGVAAGRGTAATVAVAAVAAVATPAATPPRGALGQLADALAQRGRGAAEDGPPLLATAEGQSRPPELKALRRFRGTWSRLSAQQRLREATAQVPAQAGPLNSHHLVHRALALMQQLSPGYLEHFVGHVDALLSIEQLQSPPPPPPVKGELRAATPRRKSARGR